MQGFFAVSHCFCSSAICCWAYPWMGLAERIGDLLAFPAVAGKEYNSEAEL